MRESYSRATDVAAVVARVVELHAKTVIFDVEPLAAFWDTDEETLRHGVAAVLDRIALAPEVRVVGFATNSRRRLALNSTSSGVRVLYVAAARKPASVRPYRDLPRPGVVVGDQIATDGVLAHRLGYAFIHYRPTFERIPLGPKLMHQLGRPLRPLLFGRRVWQFSSSSPRQSSALLVVGSSRVVGL
jgi:predicted HAD superfamily phosphohydrolase YqeG